MLKIILIYGGILSASLFVLIVGSLYQWPRLWLQDAPAKIRDVLPPKTPKEKKQTALLGIPFMLLVLGIPLAGILDYKNQIHPEASFAELALMAWGILMVFNLVDLVLIDWLLICYLTPKKLIYPGTEHLLGEYKKYRFHLVAFLKGCLILVIPGLILAGLVYLF